MEVDLVESNYELDINPKKVCRLCLSQSPNLQNIFSNSIVDGYIISVPEMLVYTVDITVIIKIILILPFNLIRLWIIYVCLFFILLHCNDVR